MEAYDESGLAINNKPYVMLDPRNLDHSLVCMPFVRIEVKHGQQLYSEVVEERSEFRTPIGNRGMGNVLVIDGTQNKADITEGILT